MSVNLEQQVTEGGIIYLSNIERNLSAGQLIFTFYASLFEDGATQPNESRIVHCLTFTRIQDFTELWDDPCDYPSIEQLIGIVEKTERTTTRYWIRLDQSEMCFTSSVPPQIIEFSP